MNAKKLQIIISSIVFAFIVIIGFVFFRNNEEVPVVVDNNDIEEIIEESKRVVELVEDNNTPREFRRIDDSDHVIRPKGGGSVELVFYGNFEDELSARFSKTLEELMKVYSGELVFAFRHYYFDSERTTILSSIAAECSAREDKFWDMYDLLFESQSIPISKSKYINLAEKIDLNSDDFSKCLDDVRVKDKLIRLREEADKANILGVPVIFIGEEKYVGNIPLDDFKDSTGREREGLISIIEKSLGK